MSDLPMFVINRKVFNSVSLAADATSEVIDLSEVVGYCVHLIWTGTAAGNFLVQGSNDAVNFVTVDTTAAGGTSGQHLLNVEHQHYRYVRVFYDSTSGAGSLTGYISAKRA